MLAAAGDGVSGSDSVSVCTACGAPLVGNTPLEDTRRLMAPFHAAVSWTYIGGDRAEEALLRIRRELKQAVGWWTSLDDRDWQERIEGRAPEGQAEA